VLIEKFISLNTPKISSMVVKKGWILVARSGQEILGSTQIVGNSLNGLGVNEHGLRLIINTNDSYYVFAFLSSHIGNQYLRAGIFGSAILTIEDSYIKEMLLPILQNKEIVEVNELIKTYVEFYDKAIQEETEAVNKIEQEIELWQK
jgi:type I restriction enzyme S subunit